MQQAIAWSEVNKSWIVTDTDLVASILKSGNFLSDNPTAYLQRIAEESNIEIPRILGALRDAPSVLNGDDHKRARRQFAAQLAPRIAAVAERFSEECTQGLQQVLRSGDTVDLFSQMLLPAINAALSPLGGREISAELFTIVSPSQVISSAQMFSGARLRRLEAEVSAGPVAGEPATCDHVMPLFARDPTLGSLGLSLIETVKANPGQRLCDMHWPLQFIRSSLPFVVRVAAVDTEIAGKHIRKGDTVTIYVGAFREDNSLYFGSGPHRCLGEALAKLLWERFIASISVRTERLEIEQVDYRAGDVVFVMPVKIQVKVTS